MYQVVLVDDQEMFRNMARDILERASDFKIIAEATDGTEAVKLMDELTPDLLLMDVQMPQMDGFEAARRIKERHPAAKIALTSMNNDKEYFRIASDVGALAFIPKRSLNADALRQILDAS
ncbi:MAG: response regulator transcription factor [Chloroflexi bacterium]|nr:response regulator transcription factor [Chloroflexota bacterium]